MVHDDGDAKIEDEDVLVYITIGATHSSRMVSSLPTSLDIVGGKDEKSVHTNFFWLHIVLARF
jgi:hypothetical protein